MLPSQNHARDQNSEIDEALFQNESNSCVCCVGCCENNNLMNEWESICSIDNFGRFLSRKYAREKDSEEVSSSCGCCSCTCSCCSRRSKSAWVVLSCFRLKSLKLIIKGISWCDCCSSFGSASISVGSNLIGCLDSSSLLDIKIEGADDFLITRWGSKSSAGCNSGGNCDSDFNNWDSDCDFVQELSNCSNGDEGGGCDWSDEGDIGEDGKNTDRDDSDDPGGNGGGGGGQQFSGYRISEIVSSDNM